MDGRVTRALVILGGAAVERLLGVAGAGRLTGRGHDRVLRLARTIADLEGREEVLAHHVEEALAYRLAAPMAAAA